MLEPFAQTPHPTSNKMDANTMSAVRAIGVASDHSITQSLRQRRQELANTEATLRQQRETLALTATAVESLRLSQAQLGIELSNVEILAAQRIRLESQLRSTRRHLLAGRNDLALAKLRGADLGSDSDDEEEEEDQEEDQEGEEGQEEDSEMEQEGEEAH